MSFFAFKYKRSITRAGYTWYCQSPGVMWATDPVIGWELFYTDGPSWHLMGTGAHQGWEISLNTRRLKEAMDLAAVRIQEIKDGTHPQ